MICPQCHNMLDLPASFCPLCGASLHRSGGRILTLTAVTVLVMIVGAYGYVKYQLNREPDAARQAVTEQLQARSIARQPSEPPQDRAGTAAASTAAILVAELTLADVNDHKILSAPVAVLTPGWFAFPARSGVGAYSWQVDLPSGRRFDVEGGILHDTAPVGLWQLPAATTIGQTGLMPWSPDQPVTWQPLDEQQAVQQVPIRGTENLGDFVRIPFQASEETPGVLVQNGQVVGWTFGDLMPGGYLWTGNRGMDLAAEFYPEDFYRLTFAGSREEAFLLALANEDFNDLQRLEALTTAHQLESRLNPAETPDHLAPEAIHAIMRNLIGRLEMQGRMDDLLASLAPETVLTVKDTNFISDLAGIAIDLGAYEFANALIEGLQEADQDQPVQRRNLQGMQATLYHSWLDRLLSDGDLDEARAVHQQAVERFPRDPAIHLAAVELALREQNWVLAEGLLATRNYPIELRDRVSRLQQEISALKSQEGRIVIRFRPGSRIIPVVARLGRGLNQRFIIDTGASIVTVPLSTARQLGIDISDNLPRRLFYSATGVQHAVEITLPFIALDGWVVENVRALVVDLPGQSDVGLLGMNYLSNFQMDVDTGEGLMTLTPR